MNKLVGILDYPNHAGAKEQATSMENAERIEKTGRAESLRDRVRKLFAIGVELTADEIAQTLGEPYIAIRPRLSELRTLGLIEPNGTRRPSSNGGTSHVWRWVK